MRLADKDGPQNYIKSILNVVHLLEPSAGLHTSVSQDEEGLLIDLDIISVHPQVPKADITSLLIRTVPILVRFIEDNESDVCLICGARSYEMHMPSCLLLKAKLTLQSIEEKLK